MKNLLEKIELFLISEKGKVKKWSQKVKLKFHPSPGTFKEGSPEEILTELGKDGADDGTIMKRLNFFLNRGGSGVSKEVKQKVEKAKQILKARKLV